MFPGCFASQQSIALELSQNIVTMFILTVFHRHRLWRITTLYIPRFRVIYSLAVTRSLSLSITYSLTALCKFSARNNFGRSAWRNPIKTNRRRHVHRVCSSRIGVCRVVDWDSEKAGAAGASWWDFARATTLTFWMIHSVYVYNTVYVYVCKSKWIRCVCPIYILFAQAFEGGSPWLIRIGRRRREEDFVLGMFSHKSPPPPCRIEGRRIINPMGVFIYYRNWRWRWWQISRTIEPCYIHTHPYWRIHILSNPQGNRQNYTATYIICTLFIPV